MFQCPPICRQLSEAQLPLGNGASERVPAPAGTAKAQKLMAAQSLYYEFGPLIISEYSQVVQFGSRRVQHALPRLLTLLIEFGHDAHLLGTQKKPDHSDAASTLMYNRLTSKLNQQSVLVRPFTHPHAPFE